MEGCPWPAPSRSGVTELTLEMHLAHGSRLTIRCRWFISWLRKAAWLLGLPQFQGPARASPLPPQVPSFWPVGCKQGDLRLALLREIGPRQWAGIYSDLSHASLLRDQVRTPHLRPRTGCSALPGPSLSPLSPPPAPSPRGSGERMSASGNKTAPTAEAEAELCVNEQTLESQPPRPACHFSLSPSLSSSRSFPLLIPFPHRLPTPHLLSPNAAGRG